MVAKTGRSELDRTANLVYITSYRGVLSGMPPDVILEQTTSK
jgi:hypothetical protein